MTPARIWKYVLIPLLIAATAAAQSSTRRVFDAWLEAFNSQDRAKLTAFWEKYSPEMVKGVERELHLRQESGGFTLVRVTEDDGLGLKALVKDDGELYLTISIQMKASDPPSVTKLEWRGTEPPAGVAPRASSDVELLKILKSKVDSWAAEDRFAGAVLEARNGQVLLEQAWGLADRDKTTRNEIDTQFRLGSMNKMFTSVAALQLVQQGKLSLDGTIADYWPEYPNRELASKVKIRHLMSHMGGTGDIFTREFNQRRLDIRTLQDYVKLYGERALEFVPGSRFRYSNYGMLLLGLLVEKVSGTSYYDYVRAHVFKPAGMTGTDSLPEIESVPKRATGYTRGKSGWESNSSTLPWRGTPAGGGYSTVHDLLRFAQALQNGTLLDRKLLAQATKDQTGGMRYGFGFQAWADGSFGHTGAAPGISGALHIYPKTGHVVAVLSNLDPPAADRIANFSDRRLPEK
jgi:D-alanyl-D-alanine carboxypeptidase